MSRLANRVSDWLRKRRPVTPEEFAEVADWVNEGGALDPAGPPPLLEEEADETEEDGGGSRP